MRRFLCLITGSIILLSFVLFPGGRPFIADQNARFDRYKEGFILSLWKIYPERAASAGYHKYDSVLTIPDERERNLELAFAKANLDSLARFDIKALSDNNKTDHHILENELKKEIWGITDEKTFEWNPSIYNVAARFADLISSDKDSLDKRLVHFYQKMKAIPAFYEAAKKNIKNPTLEHTQLAISQNLGGITVFEKDLPEALAKSHLSAEEKNQITLRAKDAVAAIKEFADWLKTMKNETPRSFRLGKELYMKKFELEMESGYTADQIFEKAMAHKKELHHQMAALSIQLWPKYFKGELMPADTMKMIGMMIDKLSLDHVSADSFQIAIELQIPELVRFVKEKNLLYLDPSKPLVVRRQPDYMAGGGSPSVLAPGPYDKEGNTYYNVRSIAGWDNERTENFLREFNRYVLQILNIHEAIPGHYTQLIYSNKSQSLVKALFGNRTMVEGWAVYAERMMLEEGYGNNTPEMWLMYYKWSLRSTCNAILDYSVHTKNMSKEEVIDLLMNEAFQPRSVAETKWNRVSLLQVELSTYFTGFTEIYDFRQELKDKMGSKFNLKYFHEKFLSYGSAPVKYIRQLMLAEMK